MDGIIIYSLVALSLGRLLLIYNEEGLIRRAGGGQSTVL